jgi:protein-tyrosine phosphatase
MQFLTLPLLAALATASPVMMRRAVDITTSNTNTSVWSVSNFDVGCSPAACEYNFVVARPAGPNNPGFNTTCTGNDLDKEYQACADKSVTAKMIPREYPLWEIDVKHSFEDSNKAAVNAFANGTTADSTTFTVTVYKTDV